MSDPQPDLNGALFCCCDLEMFYFSLHVLRNDKKSGSGGRIKLLKLSC